MHDPSTLAFSVRLPVPSRISRRRPSDGRETGLRWPFLILKRHEVYFGHDLIDAWHEEPGGADAGTVCGNRRLWAHPRHLRLKFPPLRSLRRRLFTTCEWCGQLGTSRRPVNVSHQWDGDERNRRARWWNGDRGLYHAECSTLADAARQCVCEVPDPGRMGRRCRLCGNFADYNQGKFREARMLAKRVGRGRRRPSPEESEQISALFLAARSDEFEEEQP